MDVIDALYDKIQSIYKMPEDFPRQRFYRAMKSTLQETNWTWNQCKDFVLWVRDSPS